MYYEASIEYLSWSKITAKWLYASLSVGTHWQGSCVRVPVIHARCAVGHLTCSVAAYDT